MKYVIGYLGQIPATDPPIIEIWNDINTYCETKATPDQCEALLGTNPLYLPPTCKSGTPFWAYMLAGFAIARITGI